MAEPFREYPQSWKSVYLRLRNPFFGVVFGLTCIILLIQMNVLGINLFLSVLLSAAIFAALLFFIDLGQGRRSIRIYTEKVVVLKRGREQILFPEQINFVLLRKIFGVEMLTLKTFSKELKYEVTETYENYSGLKRDILEFAERNNVKVKEHNY